MYIRSLYMSVVLPIYFHYRTTTLQSMEIMLIAFFFGELGTAFPNWKSMGQSIIPPFVIPHAHPHLLFFIVDILLNSTYLHARNLVPRAILAHPALWRTVQPPHLPPLPVWSFASSYLLPCVISTALMLVSAGSGSEDRFEPPRGVGEGVSALSAVRRLL